ncbi:hypothetical protein JR316_0008861 [Psilocybe cubensis]|uniref:Uncharacterized protein n=1 Tax=Psilocybe cubensis TaxID=181762 RepID=A0ACB8GT50_PSICU|nr:hypothetical protein JR316_0008861 [Psilocybe cubensis]KAH9478406.1 hypothetical protein JR316_0008861 [Psilocybe cubensis]
MPAVSKRNPVLDNPGLLPSPAPPKDPPYWHWYCSSYCSFNVSLNSLKMAGYILQYKSIHWIQVTSSHAC